MPSHSSPLEPLLLSSATQGSPGMVPTSCSCSVLLFTDLLHLNQEKHLPHPQGKFANTIEFSGFLCCVWVGWGSMEKAVVTYLFENVIHSSFLYKMRVCMWIQKKSGREQQGLSSTWSLRGSQVRTFCSDPSWAPGSEVASSDTCFILAVSCFRASGDSTVAALSSGALQFAAQGPLAPFILVIPTWHYSQHWHWPPHCLSRSCPPAYIWSCTCLAPGTLL